MKYYLFIALCLIGCNKRAPIKTGDSVCIGNRFLTVGDMETYPWVKMTINTRCADHANDPDSVINLSKLDSFQSSCVCRYSAKCRKTCTSPANILNSEECLEKCTD